MAKESVLIVEDEEMMRGILRQLLEAADFEVYSADSAETALDIFATNDIVITLTDIKMSGNDGLALLDQIKSIDDEAVVIIMTAFSSVDTAVAALRKGAYDYITKPFVNEDLVQTVRNAAQHRKLFRENRVLRRELRKHQTYSEIVGKSDALNRVFDLVNKVADTTATVLIEGESGTGKELIARSIHFNSSRRDKPFLAVNCGALPETLLESELFGHTRGSFTGAIADKKGLFRSVAGGTLFLDEVAEMPPSLQVKLLRALQVHQVVPVGASTPINYDARIVAATNRDLESEVAEGKFREDLFYRLNVIEIDVPPLRERRDDIPLLVKHFVAAAAHAQNSPPKMITNDALSALTSYSWPGNIRELEHVIERAVILSGDEVDLMSLPAKVRATTSAKTVTGVQPTLEDVEKSYVLETLANCSDDKVEAAKILGIDLSTLYRKLKRYELE
ncbi:MAG: sigma-54 dependent transcriptional regulator [Pyrinomonadaceae bacterium]